MNNQPQAGNARPKTIFNDWRAFHPVTPRPVEGAKFPGQLTWELANNGKIILKADDKVRTEGNGYQKKELELDLYNRNTFFELLLDAANNPEFERGQFVVLKHGFVRGANGSQLSENPMKQGELTIMKDKAGVISVGFSKSDYKCVFSFAAPGHSEYKEMKDGAPVSAVGKLSTCFVRGYVNTMQPLLNQAEKDNYQPPKPKNNGSNGNWNNNGGNGGGNGGNWGNKPQGGNSNGGDEDFDLDIPF